MTAPELSRPADVGAVLDRERIDALLVGFPKCGTTALAQWLASSRQVAMSVPKETFLLVPEFGRRAAIGRRGPFDGAGAGVRIEATTLNVYSPRLRSAVAERDIKVVVAIRPPEQALPSWHNQMVKAGLTGGATIEELLEHTGVAADGPEFLRDYRSVAAYGAHLRAWLDAVGHERLLVVEVSELECEPAALAVRLGTFLGIDPPTGPVPRANVYEELRMASVYRRVVRSDAGRRLQAALRRWPAVERRAARIRSLVLGRRPPSVVVGTPSPAGDDFESALDIATLNREYWTGRS